MSALGHFRSIQRALRCPVIPRKRTWRLLVFMSTRPRLAAVAAVRDADSRQIRVADLPIVAIHIDCPNRFVGGRRQKLCWRKLIDSRRLGNLAGIQVYFRELCSNIVDPVHRPARLRRREQGTKSREPDDPCSQIRGVMQVLVEGEPVDFGQIGDTIADDPQDHDVVHMAADPHRAIEPRPLRRRRLAADGGNRVHDLRREARCIFD